MRPPPTRGQSSEWIENATTKPRVVTTPASLPPCSYASGIIVSASIVRTAPPANARTNATTSGDEFWNRPYPAKDANPDTSAMAIHIDRIRVFLQPPAVSPAVEDSASGRFEMKTAVK